MEILKIILHSYFTIDFFTLIALQFHRDLTMKALLNPESLYNRTALNKSYGLTLPAIKPSRQTKVV